MKITPLQRIKLGQISLKEMKTQRENCKYAITIYDRIIVTEFKKLKNIA